MNNLLFYLASPYTHHDPEVRQWRYEMACDALGVLLQHGIHVISPIAHTHVTANMMVLPKDWEFWKEIDINILQRCDGMIVLALDGWNNSVGVSEECDWARKNGYPIFVLSHMFYDPAEMRRLKTKIDVTFDRMEVADGSLPWM